MTLADIQKLSVGDRVASPHDEPPYRLRRVTHVWHHPECPQYSRIIIASISRTALISPVGYVRARCEAVWFDTTLRRFVRKPTKRELKKPDCPAYVPVGPELPIR
jgi:hypothetical protein